MLVHRLLEDSAARRPEAPALIDGARTASYGELDLLANRVADVLRRAGVGRHDRVVLALENSVELVAAYFGSMKIGAVAVPLPAGPRSDRLASAVDDCAPRAAIVDLSTVQEIDSAHPLSRVPTVIVAGRRKPGQTIAPSMRALDDALACASDARPSVRVLDIDLAAIIYTSGSTGEPRGVMLSHRNFIANARSIVSYLGLTDCDRVMCVLPFYYVYGLSLLHTHIAVGGSIVIDNRFAFPNVVIQAIRERGVTGFAGVPSTFTILLNHSNIEDLNVATLRYVTQAGGSMPVPHIREWLRRGPQVPFFVMYGATEAAARLTYLAPDRLVDKMGSIGRPIPNVEIVVLAEDGRLAAPGEVGELVARGSNISSGYWNNPEETLKRFGPLGYRTGDLGYVDTDGYLFLVGRRLDMIKVGAHRVGAAEIENVLHEHPSVREAAVVGAPHELLGESPVAFVALNGTSQEDAESIRNFCGQRLPAHKVPTRIEFRTELPKLAGSNKIDRTALKEAAASRGGSAETS
jgi:long-chain acyl-CoA synthetase